VSDFNGKNPISQWYFYVETGAGNLTFVPTLSAAQTKLDGKGQSALTYINMHMVAILCYAFVHEPDISLAC